MYSFTFLTRANYKESNVTKYFALNTHTETLKEAKEELLQNANEVFEKFTPLKLKRVELVLSDTEYQLIAKL